jgi:oxalate decarboxylase/phosphoglucose isomerase-like protein (cupin superfamily)
MRIKFDINDVGGEIVKDNETYLLKDNKTLKNLVLSSTRLYSGRFTRGHSHAGQEEIYFFVAGSGIMVVGESRFRVATNDVILIPDGEFHQVINDGSSDLVFNCVFDGKRSH